MAISNVALTNTFDEWRVTTNQLIVVSNDLLGDGLTTYRSVTANVVTANSLFVNSLNLNLVANGAYDKANSANVVAASAFARANAANLVANLAYDQANTTYSAAVLKTGNTMTGPLVAPTVNVSTLLRVTGAATFTGNIDTTAANVVTQTLTDAATIVWNAANGQIATVTLNGNRVLSNITNIRVGTYVLHVIQNTSGGSSLTFQQGYRFSANVQPPLTTTANARDVFTFISDGSKLYGSFIPDVG